MLSRNNGKKRILIAVLALAMAATLAYAGYRYLNVKQAEGDADAVLKQLMFINPSLGKDTEGSTGNGRDPLPVISVDEINIVGCLEIPSINVMVPVTAKGTRKKGFAAYTGGSPVKGKFIIRGSRSDIFRKLPRLKPGDKAIFTDIDGVRYKYSVLTQFHLKKWDRAENDLMLRYKVDDDTWFVVGCTSEL